MTIWRHERHIGIGLLLWAALSLVAGALLWWGSDAQSFIARGVGLQCLVWGAIDAVIAGVGLLRLRRPTRDADSERRHLRRLLRLNSGLDVLYLVAGVALLLAFDRNDNPFVHGNGWGVLLQGGFLLLFDGWHVLRLDAAAVS